MNNHLELTSDHHCSTCNTVLLLPANEPVQGEHGQYTMQVRGFCPQCGYKTEARDKTAGGATDAS